MPHSSYESLEKDLPTLTSTENEVLDLSLKSFHKSLPVKKSIIQPKPVKVPHLQKKVKILQQKLRRKEKKITSLQDLLKTLRKKGILESDASSVLENCFQGLSKEIFKNEFLNVNRKAQGRRYSRDMKYFAVTLLYYSPKAYNYCRYLYLS